MKPTPEIIELARKLYAAGYRKEIEQGDWFFNAAFNEDHLWIYSTPRQEVYVKDNDNIPIPTLTDCLDWLRERVGYFSLQPYFREREPGFEPIVGWKIYIQHNPLSWKTYGDTPLEAAMLAMIKILEASDERT